MSSSGFSVEGFGFEDLIKEFEDMEISEEKQKKALSKAGEVILKNAIENVPELTGYTKKSIKKVIKKIDGDIACEIKVNSWDAIFAEYGTSKDRSHVGWFSRSVEDSEEDVIKEITKEVFK